MNASSGLYDFRETLIQFYKRQEYFILAVFHFAVALGLLLLLRNHLGVYGAADAPLRSTLLNVILALVCSMLPPGYSAGIIALVMVWDLYGLSLEAAGICAALLVLCILVYFRFMPKDTIILLLMPIACALNLHYAVPILAGLLFGPGAAAPVVFGLVFSRFVLLVEESLPVLAPGAEEGLTGEHILSNFRGLIDGMMTDREMIVLAGTLAVTVLVVCFIRNLIMRYAWVAAITVGCVLELLLLLGGDMRFGTQIDLGRVFLGIVLSFILAQIVRFFVYQVDYLRIESVRFEDEDYYYYVKAVPKVIVSLPEEDADPFSQPSRGNMPS